MLPRYIRYIFFDIRQAIKHYYCANGKGGNIYKIIGLRGDSQIIERIFRFSEQALHKIAFCHAAENAEKRTAARERQNKSRIHYSAAEIAAEPRNCNKPHQHNARRMHTAGQHIADNAKRYIFALHKMIIGTGNGDGECKNQSEHGVKLINFKFNGSLLDNKNYASVANKNCEKRQKMRIF